MKSVQSALAWAAKSLSSHGVDSARLTAELLLGHVMRWERVRVVAHPDDPLSRGIEAEFRRLVERRALGEPLQYITGRQEFYGLPFHVTPAVLIPRPETEILVEKAVFAARESGARPLHFADVGTGSGCIAVAVACKVAHSVGWAVDISIEALEIARENAVRNGVPERLGFLCSDLLECFAPRPCFDMVMSNPPYVATADAATLSAEVREHEPQVALYSGTTGLDIYRRLIPQAAERLVPGGRLLLEMGAGMSEPVVRMAEEAGLAVETVAPDLQGIPRCMMARRSHG